MFEKITLENLINFCESKPAGEEYNYEDNDTCAFAQFLTSLGFTDLWVGGYTVKINGKYYDFIELFHDNIGESVSAALTRYDRNFGALLIRLRDVEKFG